jgi:hypothetical protein
MARPTKLCPEVQERVVQAVRTGCGAEDAACAAGVSASSYHLWMKKGSRARSGIYHDFCEAVHEARAEAQVFAFAVIRQAMARGEWRAAVAYLDRHRRWQVSASPEAAEVEEAPPTLALPRLSDEDLAQLEQIRARAEEAEAEEAR